MLHVDVCNRCPTPTYKKHHTSFDRYVSKEEYAGWSTPWHQAAVDAAKSAQREDAYAWDENMIEAEQKEAKKKQKRASRNS